MFPLAGNGLHNESLRPGLPANHNLWPMIRFNWALVTLLLEIFDAAVIDQVAYRPSRIQSNL